MRIALLILLAALIAPAAQTDELTIGSIQGAGPESPYLNRFVNFRGVVVGRYEDQNTRGDIYYTLFVQDLPGAADGDPATADAVAVFLGRENHHHGDGRGRALAVAGRDVRRDLEQELAGRNVQKGVRFGDHAAYSASRSAMIWLW